MIHAEFIKEKAKKKRVTRRRGVVGQTGDTGSAGRRESARRNTGRNEREGGAGAGAVGSSSVVSNAGVTVCTLAETGGTASGWSMVDVETRLPSLPLSIVGGAVVIRSRDV